MIVKKIQIKVPDNFFDIRGLEAAMPSVLQKIGVEARDFWFTEAGRRLKSSRVAYLEALQPVGAASATSVSISLGGSFIATAVEMGTPSYSMVVPIGKTAPLNVDRQVVLDDPNVFRSGSGKPWLHPGFEGFNISDSVIEYIAEELIPKYIGEALSKL